MPDQTPNIPAIRARAEAARASLADGRTDNHADIRRLVTEDVPALLAAVEWRPISTAPDDGELILVIGGRHERSEIRHSDGAWWRMHREAAPTHWLPLPAPPVQS